MGIIAIISSIVSLANGVFSLKDRAFPQYKKEAISIWLDKVHQALLDVERELRNGNYPHEKCAYLRYCLNAMIDTLNPYLSFNEVDNLYKLADESYQVERLFHELRNMNDEEREINLSKILEAAGTFKACSDHFMTR